MKLIDAHAHMHDKKFDEDRDEVVARAFASAEDGGGELQAIVNIGTSLHESEMAVETAEHYTKKGFPMVATVGLHPHCFNGGRERDYEWIDGLGVEHKEELRMETLKKSIEKIEALIVGNPETVTAVGEIGLDYFLPGDETVSVHQRKWQRTGFVVQVGLAQKHGLPVVIHGRPEKVEESDAYHDMVEIITNYPDTLFVMHCYQGNEDVTEKLLACGNVYFSFTGTVTYSKSSDDMASNVLRMIPLDKMMVETDCPYLTPVPFRGQRNEPAFVGHVARHIADIKDLPTDAIIKATSDNTRTFFGINSK